MGIFSQMKSHETDMAWENAHLRGLSAPTVGWVKDEISSRRYVADLPDLLEFFFPYLPHFETEMHVVRVASGRFIFL